MRWLGLMLLLAASVRIGNLYAKTMEMQAKRIKTLEQLCAEMENELRFLLPPIPRLLHSMASRTAFSSLGFLCAAAKEAEAFPVCWHDALAQDKQISAEERAVLATMGDSLGTTDLQGQLAALAGCRARFAAMHEEWARGLQTRTRLARSLGVFGGLFLVILLI